MKKRKPRIIMPKPKKTIWQKFISLFKKQMTKEKILLMIEKLLKIYDDMDEDSEEIEINNLVECI